jgi:hypothetical protein
MWALRPTIEPDGLLPVSQQQHRGQDIHCPNRQSVRVPPGLIRCTDRRPEKTAGTRTYESLRRTSLPMKRPIAALTEGDRIGQICQTGLSPLLNSEVELFDELELIKSLKLGYLALFLTVNSYL